MIAELKGDKYYRLSVPHQPRHSSFLKGLPDHEYIPYKLAQTLLLFFVDLFWREQNSGRSQVLSMRQSP